MEFRGAKGQQIPEMAAEHVARRSASVAGGQPVSASVVPEALRTAAWTWFHLHEDDTVLTVLGFYRVTWRKLKRGWEIAFGPDPIPS